MTKITMLQRKPYHTVKPARNTSFAAFKMVAINITKKLSSIIFDCTLSAMKSNIRRAKTILHDALRQGLTPHKLAMTCALGVVVGLFPIFGTTTLLCFGVALLFRLNIPVIQLVNYLVAPLQLLLVIPFIKIGTILFHLNPLPYNAEQLMVLFRENFSLLFKEAGLALLIGVGVWASFSIPLFFVLYYLFFLGFRRWTKRSA